jgi:uncharacterized membrane protein
MVYELTFRGLAKMEVCMKYTSSVTIDLPRDRVLELFDSQENLYKWQQGLKSFEHIEGEPGQTGAVSRLVYDMKGRSVEMTERITNRNTPDELSFTYDAKGVWNSCINRFVELSPESTRWEMDNEFRCSGFMKLLTTFMPGSFKKQTLADMNRFRVFAEKE